GGVIGGMLIVAGGQDENGPIRAVEAYDPVSGKWNIKAPMLRPRTGCRGVVLNEKFYVLGGHDGTNCLNRVESYDWRTDTWTNEPSMLNVRNGCCAGAIDGVIYVAGGMTNSSAQVTETIESWKPGNA